MRNKQGICGLIFAFIWMAGCAPKTVTTEFPNIVYILADDLGYGDISSFNPKGKIPTPHIDRLAAEGMRFTDAHSASAVCTPTRYSILTGRYCWRTRLKQGVLTGKSKALIPESRSTVASMLRNHDYHTAFIGKWHLGWDWALKTDTIGGEGWDARDFDNLDFSRPITHTPNDLGFDYAYGHSGSLDMAPYVYVENGRVTEIPDTVTVDTGKYTWWRKGPTAPDFVHEEVTPHFFEKATSYIRSRKKDDPFFLYLALPSPHTPILPTEEWLGRSGLNPYADFVMMIDEYVGNLMAALKEKGFDENTLVIFTSDNGCSPQADFPLLAEKGHFPSYLFRGHKADIYEGGHRVPFIAKWEGVIEPGTVSDQLVCTTDLMATCAEVIGHELSPGEGEDSFSLLPHFRRKAGEITRQDIIHHSINGSFAIRKDNWKLIMAAGSGGWSFPTPKEVEQTDTFPPVQLFNLDSDPGETRNLQASEPEKVVALKNLITLQIREGRSRPGLRQENDTFEGEWWQVEFARE